MEDFYALSSLVNIGRLILKLLQMGASCDYLLRRLYQCWSMLSEYISVAAVTAT
mgnify:CR=1 FL=1